MSPFSKTGLCWAESPLLLLPPSLPPLSLPGGISPLSPLSRLSPAFLPGWCTGPGQAGRARDRNTPEPREARVRSEPSKRQERAAVQPPLQCLPPPSSGQRRSEQRMSECWHHLGLGALTVPRYSLSYHSASYLLLMEHLPTSNLGKCHS